MGTKVTPGPPALPTDTASAATVPLPYMQHTLTCHCHSDPGAGFRSLGWRVLAFGKGLFLPGILLLGTIHRQDNRRMFMAVYGRRPAVTLELQPGTAGVQTIVVSTKDAERVAQEVIAASNAAKAAGTAAAAPCAGPAAGAPDSASATGRQQEQAATAGPIAAAAAPEAAAPAAPEAEVTAAEAPAAEPPASETTGSQQQEAEADQQQDTAAGEQARSVARQVRAHPEGH